VRLHGKGQGMIGDYRMKCHLHLNIYNYLFVYINVPHPLSWNLVFVRINTANTNQGIGPFPFPWPPLFFGKGLWLHQSIFAVRRVVGHTIDSCMLSHG
jgi:hypothetical protein